MVQTGIFRPGPGHGTTTLRICGAREPTATMELLQTRWRRIFWSSALARDRGFGTLLNAATTRLLGGMPAMNRWRSEQWQRTIENGIRCIGYPTQMSGLDRVLDFAKQRGLDTTIVLFPRKPSTLSEAAKTTTLPAFRSMVDAVASPRGLRVIDLTSSTPLNDDDFMADFDHVSAQGNLKFARWALDGPLSFLLHDPAHQPDMTPK